MRDVRPVLLALLCLGVAALPAAVAAQPAQTRQLATATHASGSALPVAARVLLLRMGGSVRSPLAAPAERALASVLAELGILVTRSPLPFHDAQLVAGCSGPVRACGAQVATALESEQLAVAVLEDEPAAGSAHVQLYVFEGSGAVGEASGPLARAPGEPLEASLRPLVMHVFGGAAPMLSPAPAPARAPVSASPEQVASGRSQVLRAVGWTTVGVGGALLASALATSVAAHNAGQAYARSEVRSFDEADRALADFESAQRRADVSQVLWGVGAGTVAAGAFVLLWERFAAPWDRNLQHVHSVHNVHNVRKVQNMQNVQQASAGGRRSVSMAAMPAPAGVSFTLRGEL